MKGYLACIINKFLNTMHDILFNLFFLNADIVYTEVIIIKGDDFMEIAPLSSTNQASLMQQVSIAVTKKMLDATKENGQALTKMMELSVNPNLGKNIDLSV